MKKPVISLLFMLLTAVVIAQPTLDLGIKAGINKSKMSLDIDDYTSESITKAHFGVFGRVGWGNVFVQPEAYYSAKGGDLSTNVYQTVTSFDYSALDVPVLLGVKIIKGGAVELHAVAGPVFSFITSNDIDGNALLTKDYYEDNYLGFQYGLGLDILFLSLQARMEHAQGSFYSHPDFDGKNRTFMLSVGFKIF